MSSLVLIKTGMEEACVAFLLLNNINDTLLEGISRTIQYLQNQTMKKIRTVIRFTRVIVVKKF